MFPEGTRSPKGKLREFKRGLGYLVAAERVSILPVHISGTTLCCVPASICVTETFV